MKANPERERGNALRLGRRRSPRDVSRDHLTQIGGTGVFVNALRESLLRGEVDFAEDLIGAKTDGDDAHD